MLLLIRWKLQPIGTSMEWHQTTGYMVLWSIIQIYPQGNQNKRAKQEHVVSTNQLFQPFMTNCLMCKHNTNFLQIEYLIATRQAIQLSCLHQTWLQKKEQNRFIFHIFDVFCLKKNKFNFQVQQTVSAERGENVTMLAVIGTSSLDLSIFFT